MAFDLKTHSISVILANQSTSGAYIASPNFPVYHYSWFRDGAFIAYAMDRVGQFDSSARFHSWAARVINDRQDRIEQAVEKIKNSQPLTGEDILNTRYLVSGLESNDDWTNFQLDGFGTWLWALEQHAQLSGSLLDEDQIKASRLVATYLTALWSRPCYDCWEEFGDRVHLYTLAAIYAGLRAEAHLNCNQHDATLKAILDLILAHATDAGGFEKFMGSTEVDASLLGLSVPYGVVSPEDVRMRKTVSRIESELRMENGGVHRYATDTYYGGGEWLLLTAWLGWYYTTIGDSTQAQALYDWVVSHADANGDLPEQVSYHLNDGRYYEYWRDRWGEIAKPLLWSHAMFLILNAELSYIRPSDGVSRKGTAE